MERVYVRLAPGHVARGRRAQDQRDGQDALAKELPQGQRRAGAHQRRLAEQRAQRDDQPELRARTWASSASRSTDAGAAQASRSARSPTRSRDDPRSSDYPGVEFLQWPGGLVASVFSNGYIAPLVVEVRGDNLEELDEQASAVAEVARTVPGVRDICPSLQIDYPEVRVETDRDEGGHGRRHARATRRRRRSRRRSATSTRRASGSTPNNGQSYYVVTYYDGTVVDDPNALAQLPVRVVATTASRSRSAPTPTSAARRARSPSSATSSSARRTCCMQTEGRDIGSAAARARDGAAQPIRARATSSSTSSARSS